MENPSFHEGFIFSGTPNSQNLPLLILNSVFNLTELALTLCTIRHNIQTKSKSNIYKPNLHSHGTRTYLSRAYFTQTISNHTTTILNLVGLILKSLTGEPTSIT